MNQMEEKWILQNRKEDDFYALDKKFLSGHYNDPIEIVSIEPKFISFLLMNSLLYREQFQKNQTVIFPSAEIKKLVFKHYSNLNFNEYFTGEFFPFSIPKKSMEDENPLENFPFFEGRNFSVTHGSRTTRYASSGGFIGNHSISVQSIVESLFSKFSLTGKKGKLYLRTSHSSYLYILNPNQKKKIFFVQEKKEEKPSFLFFCIDVIL